MFNEELKKEFLMGFVGEIILNLRAKNEEQEDSRLEEARRLNAINSEKLKQKFRDYSRSHYPLSVIKPIVPLMNNVIPSNVPRLEQKPLNPGLNKKYARELSTESDSGGFQELSLEPVHPMRGAHNASAIERPIVEEQYEVSINSSAERSLEPMQVINHESSNKLIKPEMNFGKLMFLVRDPNISSIECGGDGKKIVIRRGNSTFVTQTIMKREEIINFLNSFSQFSKTPIKDGVLNAKFSNLALSANLSEQAISFIIKKQSVSNTTSFSSPQPSSKSPGFIQAVTRPMGDNGDFEKSIMHL